MKCNHVDVVYMPILHTSPDHQSSHRELINKVLFLKNCKKIYKLLPDSWKRMIIEKTSKNLIILMFIFCAIPVYFGHNQKKTCTNLFVLCSKILRNFSLP